MAPSKRVVLVGANPFALRLLGEYLALAPELAVVAEATTADEVIAALRACRPDLCVLRPEHFPNDGLDLSYAIRSRFPTVKLVVVSDRASVEVMLAYATLGIAAHYRNDNLSCLLNDLPAVIAGRVMLDPQLVDAVGRLLRTLLGQTALEAALVTMANQPATRPGPGDRARAGRRQTVVQLAGQGKTNAEIARDLHVSLETVREHLKRHRARVGHVPRALLGRTLDQ